MAVWMFTSKREEDGPGSPGLLTGTETNEDKDVTRLVLMVSRQMAAVRL